MVRAGEEGFVERLVAAPGQPCAKGDALLVRGNPQLQRARIACGRRSSTRAECAPQCGRTAARPQSRGPAGRRAANWPRCARVRRAGRARGHRWRVHGGPSRGPARPLPEAGRAARLRDGPAAAGGARGHAGRRRRGARRHHVRVRLRARSGARAGREPAAAKCPPAKSTCPAACWPPKAAASSPPTRATTRRPHAGAHLPVRRGEPEAGAAPPCSSASACTPASSTRPNPSATSGCAGAPLFLTHFHV